MVKIVQNGYFVEKKSGKAIVNGYNMTEKVPRQMPKDSFSQKLL
jgi:hypothetical protein